MAYFVNVREDQLYLCKPSAYLDDGNEIIINPTGQTDPQYYTVVNVFEAQAFLAELQGVIDEYLETIKANFPLPDNVLNNT